jgi:hypothetical protein
MDVIWHDHPGIQLHAGKMAGNTLPQGLCHLSQGWVVKQQLALIRTDGDEIGPRLTIVVSREPDRPPMVTLRIKRRLRSHRPPVYGALQ